MQTSNSNQKATSNAFEIVTPSKSKKTNLKNLIIVAAVFIFLGAAVFLGVYLVQQQQNIQEKAAPSLCPAAEQCPNSKNPNLLQSCHPGESDGSTRDSFCNKAGRVETCGSLSTKYCCPAPGAAWTRDMTVCNSLKTPTPSPKPTLTPTPTLNPSPSVVPTVSPTLAPTSTPKSSATPTPTAKSSTSTPTITPTPTSTSSINLTPTPVPIPETGIEWPTVFGIIVGVGTIIGSILLAL